MSTVPSKDVSSDTPSGSNPPQIIRGVKVFQYPKIIYMYPSCLVGLICGFAMLSAPKENLAAGGSETVASASAAADVAVEPAVAENGADTSTKPTRGDGFGSYRNIVGLIFLGCVAFNFLIMAIDFPRFTIITVIIFGAFLIVFLVLLGERMDLFSIFSAILGRFYVSANAGFYFTYSLILLCMAFIVFLTRYLDYWEIRANEILHHHGPFSDLNRYPTINMSFYKEIPDVMEYFLAGAGRLVLKFPGEERLTVLENVMFINSIEEKLKDMMGQLSVTVDKGR